MKITPADLSKIDIQDLLRLHLEEAAQQVCFSAFSIERLQQGDMRFFAARTETGDLMGCAGLKFLDSTHGEVKSVRTDHRHLRKGVSTALMAHLTVHARAQGLTRLSLETHPTPAYAAARKLYERLGYAYYGPFGDYTDTDKSVFMTKVI